MDPSNKENSSLPVLSSLPEQGSGSGLETAADSPEQSAVGAERGQMPTSALQTADPAGSAMTIPLPMPSALTPSPSSDASVPATNVALPADDGDLIEKEWVTRAKQIVERTRDDPYKQSEDLTMFKADYMKKRYGKTIKVNR